jgi:predicted DCC family thiol-disulfide oxidoreductase YuxK
MAWISSDQKAQDIFVKEYSWSVYSFVDTRYYTKSSAFWRLVKASPFSRISYISSLPGVLWLGDIVYDVVARHRSRTCAVGLN